MSIFDKIPSWWAQTTGQSKYAMTGEEVTIRFLNSYELGEVSLQGIYALRDIPEYDVKKGDLGGFVQHSGNLSHAGSAWVADNAMVMGGGFVASGILRDFSMLVGGLCYAEMKNYAAVFALFGGGVCDTIDGKIITIYPTGSSMASAMMPGYGESDSLPGCYPARVVNYTYPSNDKSFPERRNAKAAEKANIRNYLRDFPVFKV